MTNCQITSANGLLPAGGPLIRSYGVAHAGSEDKSWITFLRLENRHTGEILRMRRVHDAQGRIDRVEEDRVPHPTNAATGQIRAHSLKVHL